MNISLIDVLSEEKCKQLLDFLIKKAFGSNATIEFRHEMALYKLVVMFNSGLYLYLFNFNAAYVYVLYFSNKHEFYDAPTWKNVLKQCLDIASHNGYVSYLRTKPHMIDNSMTLEQILIEQEVVSAIA